MILSLAACGGGSSGSSTPATQTSSSTVKGTLSVKPDLSKLKSTARKSPKFIGPSADTLSYVVYDGSTIVIPTTTIALSSCSPTCPSIALPPGSNYGIQLELLLGTTEIGCASWGVTGGCTASIDTTSPITITSSTTTPISPIVEPVTSGNSAGPTLSVSSSAVFIANTSNSYTITLQELDPVGNLLNTSHGPINDWPEIDLNLNDPTGGCFALDTTSVTSPPATSAGTPITLSFTAPCTVSGSPSVTVSAYDGSTQSNTISIPIVSLNTTTSSISMTNPGDSGSFTATELSNMSPSTFTTNPIGLNQSCGSGNINVTQGSYVTGPGQLQQTYTVQQVGATAPMCHVRITATDYAALHADVSINGG